VGADTAELLRISSKPVAEQTVRPECPTGQSDILTVQVSSFSQWVEERRCSRCISLGFLSCVSGWRH